MVRKLLPLSALSVLGACAGGAPEVQPPSPAEELLAHSQRFHDPSGRWRQETIHIVWTSQRPEGRPDSVYRVALRAGGDFSLAGERAGHAFDYRVEDGVVRYTVDGKSEVDPELQQRLLLNREDGMFWRNYYEFLAALPLDGAGAGWVDPEVVERELEGRIVLAVRIGFPPEIGTDLWTLYFDPETAALVGCRFDRADPSRDGETIVFSGLSQFGSLRLPRKRSWHMNSNWRHIGTDVLEAAR